MPQNLQKEGSPHDTLIFGQRSQHWTSELPSPLITNGIALGQNVSINSKPRKLRHLSSSPSFIGTVATGETAVALAGLGSLLGNFCSNSNV